MTTEPMAADNRVRFASGPLWLEGRLDQAPGPDAVIITHPHPLYGGEMDNPVVATLAEAYQRLGYATLRFNFRGVGASEGAYDDGRGSFLQREAGSVGGAAGNAVAIT
jgi:hypothetical protein